MTEIHGYKNTAITEKVLVLRITKDKRLVMDISLHPCATVMLCLFVNDDSGLEYEIQHVCNTLYLMHPSGFR
jgi:hypothetical protein